jgi:hypothetical protein
MDFGIYATQITKSPCFCRITVRGTHKCPVISVAFALDPSQIESLQLLVGGW